MELKVDTLWTYITGAFPQKLLDSVTAYRPYGFWFSDKYKRGFWDGYVRFTEYDRSKKQYRFPTGFISRVTAALDQYACPYRLFDNRCVVAPDPVFELCDGPKSTIHLNEGPYAYQGEALQLALSKQRGIIKIATGGGKTEVAAAIINSLALPTIWLTHRTGLAHQTAQRLSKRLQVPIGIVGDGYCDIQNITVGTTQTFSLFSKRPELMAALERAEVIFGDEVHHLSSDTWYDCFKVCPAPWRFGLSATPDLDAEGLALLAMTGDIIYEISARELILRGVLVPPRIWFLRFACEPVRASQWQRVYKEGIVNNVARHRALASVAKQFTKESKSCLTLVRQIAHGDMLADFFNYQGIRTAFLYSAHSFEERQKTINKLVNHDIDNVVGQVEVFGEGTDIPRLDAIINATGARCGGDPKDGESGRLTKQIIGRTLRASSDKAYCDYVDVIDNQHDSLRSASKARLHTLESEGYGPLIKYWSEYQSSQ